MKFYQRWEATFAYRNALKSGALVPRPCLVCGHAKTSGHHYNYDKPLDVMWFCAKHHSQFHALHPSRGYVSNLMFGGSIVYDGRAEMRYIQSHRISAEGKPV